MQSLASSFKNEGQVNSYIEKCVNCLFIEHRDDIPSEARDSLPRGERLSFDAINKTIFKKGKIDGNNVLSKEHNKYAFRLLQIFGFRDEALVSLIDKDHMKFRLKKALNQKKFN